MSLAGPIDAFMKWVKWPVAITVLLMLPAVTIETWGLGKDIVVNPDPLIPFGIGLGGYWLAWVFVFSSRSLGHIFSTMEHEFTHAIFAWMTFHHVSDFKATFNQGGHVLIRGGRCTNWLIAIGPYWFPTLAIPVLAVLWIGPQTHGDVVAGLLGVAMSYHLTSTYLEIHPGQPDLNNSWGTGTGYTFAWMFLPTMNILVLAVVVAFAYSGVGRAEQFLLDSVDQVRDLYVVLFDKLGDLFHWVSKELN